MWNPRLDDSQALIKVAGRNIHNVRYADETTLMAESEEELKSLLKVKENEKAGLKLNIQKTDILASGPITSWKTDGGKVETVTDFIFLGSKITADGDCSHEIKKCLILGRKAMTNLDSVLKSRDITLPLNNCIVKAVVNPVVIYECESWTIKKTEHQKIDAFELWCWKTLESPLDNKEIKSVNPEISPEYSLEGLILKLKLQYFGHMMWRANSLQNIVMLAKIRARERGCRGWDSWMDHLLNGHECEQTLGDSEVQGILVFCSSWGRKESDMT